MAVSTGPLSGSDHIPVNKKWIYCRQPVAERRYKQSWLSLHEQRLHKMLAVGGGYDPVSRCFILVVSYGRRRH